MAGRARQQPLPEQVDVVVNDGVLVFDPAKGKQVGGGSTVTLPTGEALRLVRHGHVTSEQLDQLGQLEPSSAALVRRAR